MKTFKSYLNEGRPSKEALDKLDKKVKFSGASFVMDSDGDYVLQGKYKNALIIGVGDGVVTLNMNIGSDELEKWISDMQQKTGEKKWPEDDWDGKSQEKYFDKPVIHGKIWKAATKYFKKKGYGVELGD